mmetsp:Transcript_64282/g.172057  ORF Transcript_64282/g.172057 Transcript_64282/m.172057 type:complete len:222 (-) Transcript_64282:790-1455(-)
MQQPVIQQGGETGWEKNLLNSKRLAHQHSNGSVALPGELQVRVWVRPVGPQLRLEFKEPGIPEEPLHHLLEKFAHHPGAACHFISESDIQAPSDVRLLFILPVSQEVIHDELRVPADGELLVETEALLILPEQLLGHIDHQAPPPEGHRDQGRVGEEGAELPRGVEGLGEGQEIRDPGVAVIPPALPFRGFFLLVDAVQNEVAGVNLRPAGASFPKTTPLS